MPVGHGATLDRRRIAQIAFSIALMVLMLVSLSIVQVDELVGATAPVAQKKNRQLRSNGKMEVK